MFKLIVYETHDCFDVPEDVGSYLILQTEQQIGQRDNVQLTVR